MYPTILCNMIDRKYIFCPYSTFVTQIIVFKAILINFPSFYLQLNTYKVKYLCLSVAVIQWMLIILGFLLDILDDNCGFVNVIDMDEKYNIVSKETMEVYVKYTNLYPRLILFTAYPLSLCYELFTVLYKFIRFLMLRYKKVRPSQVECITPAAAENTMTPSQVECITLAARDNTMTPSQVECITLAAIENTMTPSQVECITPAAAENTSNCNKHLSHRFVPKMRNPLSHNIALIITLANTISVILIFVRRFLTNSYPVSAVIILIERMWLIVCPLVWFYKHEAAVQFNLNRLKQLRMSF